VCQIGTICVCHIGTIYVCVMSYRDNMCVRRDSICVSGGHSDRIRDGLRHASYRYITHPYHPTHPTHTTHPAHPTHANHPNHPNHPNRFYAEANSSATREARSPWSRVPGGLHRISGNGWFLDG
jgi:hypothetical protein